jgi:hypothetical protein
VHQVHDSQQIGAIHGRSSSCNKLSNLSASPKNKKSGS